MDPIPDLLCLHPSLALQPSLRRTKLYCIFAKLGYLREVILSTGRPIDGSPGMCVKEGVGGLIESSFIIHFFIA